MAKTKQLPPVPYIKVTDECRKCIRYISNKGPCGGRKGLNICLVYKYRGY